MKRILVLLCAISILTLNVKAVTDDGNNNVTGQKVAPDTGNVLADENTTPSSNPGDEATSGNTSSGISTGSNAVVNDDSTSTDDVAPSIDDKAVVTDGTHETAALFTATANNNKDKSSAILYIGIGAGSAIVLAFIGYVTSRKPKKEEKNNV